MHGTTNAWGTEMNECKLSGNQINIELTDSHVLVPVRFWT